jgi:hypothetical protein
MIDVKSAEQCARESEISRSSTIHSEMLMESSDPRLLHAINEDDPDQSLQFCEWFLTQCT